MSKKFSTKAQELIKDPLNNLPFIFYDEFESVDTKPPVSNKPQKTMVVQSMSQLDKVYSDNNSSKKSPNNDLTKKQNNKSDDDTSIDTTEKDEAPTTSQPEPTIDYSNIDPKDLTIEQLLQLKLDQHHIQNVTIKHLGYNVLDEYIITEYDVIDNQTNNVLLIINVRLKEVRFQIPKHFTTIKEPKKRGPKSKKKIEQTPMEQVAREMKKELKYSWSNWF